MGLTQSTEDTTSTPTTNERVILKFELLRVQPLQPTSYSWSLNQIHNNTDLCGLRQLVLDLTASHNEEFPHNRLAGITISLHRQRDPNAQLRDMTTLDEVPNVIIQAMALTLANCDRPKIRRLFSKPLFLKFTFRTDKLLLQFSYLLYHMLLSVGVAVYPRTTNESPERDGFLFLMLHTCATALRQSRTGPAINHRRFATYSTTNDILDESLLSATVDRYICRRCPSEINRNNNNNNNDAMEAVTENDDDDQYYFAPNAGVPLHQPNDFGL